MAPEHGSWNQVDKQQQGQIKEKLVEQELDLANCVNQKGLAFLVQDGVVVRVCAIEELSEGQLSDSLKMSSSWHVVKPIEGTAKGDSIRSNRIPCRNKRSSRKGTGSRLKGMYPFKN